LGLKPVIEGGRGGDSSLHGAHEGVERAIIARLDPREPASVEAVRGDLVAAVVWLGLCRGSEGRRLFQVYRLPLAPGRDVGVRPQGRPCPR